MKRFSVVLTMALAAACGAEEPVPSQPTYVDDVEPILRANCFGCHGAGDASGKRPAGASRWDVLDKTKQDKYGALAADDSDVTTREPTIVLLADPASGSIARKGGLQMPPSSATPLSSRDYAVLTKFFKSPTLVRGERSPNAKPRAAWLSRGKTFVVTDADHDQVLGEIECSNMVKAPITRTGAHAVPGPPPCTLTLHDGQDEVTVPLAP